MKILTMPATSASSHRAPQHWFCQPPACEDAQQGDEALAAEVLAYLGAAVPAAPSVVDRRRAAAASTNSGSSGSGYDLTDSDAEEDNDEAYRPCKVRVLPSPGSPGGMLARRSYTWRGISSRRAQKQLRQLDTQQQQQQQQAVAADAGTSPTHSTRSTASDVDCEPCPTCRLPQQQQVQQQAQQQQAQQQEGSLPLAAVAGPNTVAAAEAAAGTKEGDRDWAALTTWLRMNIHNPRTAKKVVPFVGQQDGATGRWTFGLNPALCWAEVSPDTRRRLQHLPAEASKAFAAKYPGRPPGDWRLKSQKYKPRGTPQTFLVWLEDIVISLHSVYLQHEGSGSPGKAAASEAGASEAGASGAAASGAAASGTASVVALSVASPSGVNGAAASGVGGAAVAGGHLASCGTSALLHMPAQ